MGTNARAAVERAAQELLRVLAELPPLDEPLKVTTGAHQLVCVVQVAPANPPAVERAACRADIMVVMRAGRGAQTRKDIIRALKAAGKTHGTGTVAKALAELTTSGLLVNPKDKRGYRLDGWRPVTTPSLFD